MNASGRSDTVTFVDVVFVVSRYVLIMRKSPGWFGMSREPTDEAVHDNLAPVSVPVSSTSVLTLSQPSFLDWFTSSDTALFQFGRARSKSGTPAISSGSIGVPLPTRFTLMTGPCDGAWSTRLITIDLDLAVAPFGAVATANSVCSPVGALCHTTLYGGPSSA